VLDALARHSWPGNVRELANVIEHASILCDNGTIQLEHLPGNFEARGLREPQLSTLGPISLRDLELKAIDQALARHGGNKPKAAEELGISLKTLYNKLNQVTLRESA
jgi:two-component system NtrC family response regulator